MQSHQLGATRVLDVYNLIQHSMLGQNFTRAEVIAGLMLVLGDQYNGGKIADEKVQQLFDDLGQWLSMYFAEKDETFTSVQRSSMTGGSIR